MDTNFKKFMMLACRTIANDKVEYDVRSASSFWLKEFGDGLRVSEFVPPNINFVKNIRFEETAMKYSVLDMFSCTFLFIRVYTLIGKCVLTLELLLKYGILEAA